MHGTAHGWHPAATEAAAHTTTHVHATATHPAAAHMTTTTATHVATATAAMATTMLAVCGERQNYRQCGRGCNAPKPVTVHGPTLIFPECSMAEWNLRL